MRSIDEQMELILQKAQKKQEKDRQMRVRTGQTAVMICGFAVMLFAAVGLSRIRIPEEMPLPEGYGSLISGSPAAGHVLIGTLAFVLGVAVTLACVCFERSKGKKKS